MSIRERFVTIIILILCAIFFFNVGFATDSEEMNSSIIKENEFRIDFVNGKVLDKYGTNNVKIETSIDNQNISLSDLDLEYPGAYAKFSTDVVNRGKYDARIERLIVNGFENSSAIRFRFLNEDDVYNTIIKPEENLTIYFLIEWDENVIDIVNETITFNIQIPCCAK